MGIGDLNIDEFLSTEYTPDQVKALLMEGVSAYQSATKLTTKNQELIGENRKYSSQAREFEQILSEKGLDLEGLRNFNPNPNNDEQIKKFQSQLESDRKSYEAKLKDIQAQAEQAAKERDELRSNLQQSKIRQTYQEAAKAAGVANEFVDDFYHVLQGRGIEMYVDEASGNVRAKRANDVVDYDVDVMLANLKTDAKYQHYYSGKFAGGSGTNPNNSGNSRASVVNPFAKETFNLTEQTKLYNTDPDLAERLKKMANGG